MKKFNRLNATLLLSMALCPVSGNGQAYQYPFQNPDLNVDQRADNILSLMTLDEKVAAFANPAVPRLNLPDPGSSEGLHGVVRRAMFGNTAIPTTSFAQVIGMAETWDPELIQRAASAEAYEARYISQSDKYKKGNLEIWAPNADLARDPRWGRNEESYGEDPFFDGTMVVAFVKGLQGNDPKYWEAAALLKHFFANSNETTRGGSSSNFDERLMREYYSVPFRMGFTEGGARSYMAAYNAWNGVPMAVNPVLKDVVAKEWGADWIISSDFGAIAHVVELHKFLKTREEVVTAAIKVGMNQFIGREDDATLIKQAITDRRLTEAEIDAALKGKYKTAIRLGVLDPPSLLPYSKIGAPGETEPWNTEKHKAIALDVARESVVLLKNANGFLPLNKAALKSIAVVGPLADQVLIDLYGGPMPYAVTPLQGIRNRVGSAVTVNYAASNDNNAAVDAAKASDYAVVVVGNDPMCGAQSPMEMFNSDASTKPCGDPGEGREGRDRESLDLSQEQLVKEVYAANPRTVVVLISSFPYAIRWSQENIPAILHLTHAAQEQGTALADVLFGEYSPAGRLNQTWPKSLDQLPPMMDYDIRHGRTYMYFKGEPLYPFGFGLSYTTFKYSGFRTSSDRIPANGEIKVGVEITNTGTRDGDEVVQLYASHRDSKVDRPTKQLVGFKRITVPAGQTKTVDFSLKAEALAYWSQEKDRFVVEKDKVQLSAGSSSADLRLEKTVAVR